MAEGIPMVQFRAWRPGTQPGLIVLVGALVMGALTPAFANPPEASEPVAENALGANELAADEDVTAVVPPPNADPIVVAVQQHLETRPRDKKTNANDLAALKAYYTTTEDPALWVGDTGLTKRARVARAELSLADNWGLEARHYKLPSVPGGAATPEQLADAEIAFGLTVLKYARHARQGRVRPSSVTRINDFPGLSAEDVAEMWQDLVNAGDVAAALRSLHPTYPQFKRLRQALLKARGVTEITTGALPTPKPDATSKAARIDLPRGEDLTVGMQHKDVLLLRKRLGVEADLGANTHYFDAPLALSLIHI